jgi:hypothetical protein
MHEPVLDLLGDGMTPGDGQVGVDPDSQFSLQAVSDPPGPHVAGAPHSGHFRGHALDLGY